MTNKQRIYQMDSQLNNIQRLFMDGQLIRQANYLAICRVHARLVMLADKWEAENSRKS